MSLLFSDSFDSYATADRFKKWTGQVHTGVNDNSSIGAFGRFSTNGWRIEGANAATHSMGKTVNPADNVCFVALAFTPVSALSTHQNGGSFTTDSQVFHVRDPNGVIQGWLRINQNGTLAWYRDNNTTGTLVLTSSLAISQGTTHYIEVKLTVHNSTGAVEIRIDGQAAGSASSVNTRGVNSAINGWATVALGPLCRTSGTVQANYDDVLILDGANSQAFWGDQRVSVLRPNANGNSNQSTPLGGGDRYTEVDETSLDNETSYNTFASVNDKDTYGCSNVPTSGAPVKAVVVNMVSRKVDVGVVEQKAVARISGVDYVGAGFGIPDSYITSQQIWETSPASATAWTTGEIDGAEFGLQKTA